ncbi:MAG: hypothetical protein GXP42_07680 [Chloroflexi bacterium]|nr:hypothetical protein [Chloroflexota bacterium]
MTQRTALFAALALTAFVIIGAASVMLALPSIRSANASDITPTVETPVQQTASPENADAQALLDTIQTRESAYRAQIEQANQQLQEAYQRLQQLEAQNSELLQREQIYQQRLQESNQIIESMRSSQPQIGSGWSDDDAREYGSISYRDDDDDHDEYYRDDDDDEYRGSSSYYESDDDDKRGSSYYHDDDDDEYEYDDD